MSLAVGSTIAGKYVIQRLLGRGGMGTVYLARHLLLDRSVAIKILRSEVAEHLLARERLVREGRALARLRGQHIARVLDVEAQESGLCFLVLEYLEGEHLGRVIERLGSLPVADSVGYILEACEALAEAHREGIIHRDIKPSNLFVTTLDDGTRGIKVIDFGISKCGPTTEALTQSGAVVGSPCYMAPEQMRSSATVDVRCDIWALGVVLYEMLTGQPPHAGSNVLEICGSILESEPKSPKALRTEVPLGIDLAVRRCLARNPEERFANAEDLARTILPYSGSIGDRFAWIVPDEVKLPPVERATLGHTEIDAPASVGHTIEEPSLAVPGSGRNLWIASGLLAVVVVLVALLSGGDRHARLDRGTTAALPTAFVEPTFMSYASTAPSGVSPVTSVEESSQPLVRNKPPLERQRPSALAPSQVRPSPSESSIGKPTNLTHKGEGSANVNSAVQSPGDSPDPVLHYGRF